VALQTLNCTNHRGELTSATSVILASSDGSYGVINLATGAVVVPVNTPVANYVTGVYQYDVSALITGTQYQISWQITHGGTTQYATNIFTVGTGPQLNDIKPYLRLDPSNTSFDPEVQDLINAAQADLVKAGVAQDVLDSGDPLVRRAISTYCKANFGYDPDNQPFMTESYTKMKIALMNITDYQPLTVELRHCRYEI